MKRRAFIIGSAASSLLALLPFRGNATPVAGKLTLPSPAAPKVRNHEFKNRAVTIMGTSKLESCAEDLGRFYAATQSPTIHPTFSFSSDDRLATILESSRPKDDMRLISFVGKTVDFVRSAHMQAALRHNPDLFIFEQLAGSHSRIPPNDLQKVFTVGSHVAGAVIARTPAELFELVHEAFGDEIGFILSGEPKIQVFYDMVDVTEGFVKWVERRSESV